MKTIDNLNNDDVLQEDYQGWCGEYPGKGGAAILICWLDSQEGLQLHLRKMKLAKNWM